MTNVILFFLLHYSKLYCHVFIYTQKVTYLCLLR